MRAEEIQAKIIAGLPDCEAIVQDPAQDETHFEAVVTSSAFEGLSRVAQHQLVYGTLGSLMDVEIHALALRTYTLEQWKQR